MPNYSVYPGGNLQGLASIPGDKSISHRALMLSAIANGQSRIKGCLFSKDTLATMYAMQAMGVKIARVKSELIVDGVGDKRLCSPKDALDMGNSGTSTRLLAGLLAGQGVDCELIGDASLMQRPMQRIIDPLQLMGANISGSSEGTLPIKIRKSDQLIGIDYTLPIASAQLKSCLLLAGLGARGKTCIYEPVETRDHTERMLQQFGYPLSVDGRRLCLFGGERLQASDIMIPSDISSAAFFIIGACIAPSSDIMLKGIGTNPRRSEFIRILQMMGADISLHPQAECSGEPVADIRVRSSQLRGTEITAEQVPNVIDEIPAILVAAACAKGQTRISGAAELRFKESDRLVAMRDGLRSLGIQVEELEDGIIVNGGAPSGGVVDSFTDHRIAMAFAMVGMVCQEEVKINHCANVQTSFPDFVETAQMLGLNIKVEE